MQIVHVGYDSTNYYLITGVAHPLLIDVGFPGTLGKLRHQLTIKNLQLASIAYLLCTHYHPDHAGLAQELVQQGIRLVVADMQRAAVPLLRTQMKPSYNYQEIRLDSALGVSIGGSRAFLKGCGIDGEIMATPGHSDDSISLLLDTGAAFVGDLSVPLDGEDASLRAMRASWQALQAHGAQVIYPGHGKPFGSGETRT